MLELFVECLHCSGFRGHGEVVGPASVCPFWGRREAWKGSALVSEVIPWGGGRMETEVQHAAGSS